MMLLVPAPHILATSLAAVMLTQVNDLAHVLPSLGSIDWFVLVDIDRPMMLACLFALGTECMLWTILAMLDQVAATIDRAILELSHRDTSKLKRPPIMATAYMCSRRGRQVGCHRGVAHSAAQCTSTELHRTDVSWIEPGLNVELTTV